MNKIFVSGDWHGNVLWAQKMIELAAEHECSRLVQLGDFGIWPGISGVNFLDKLEKQLLEYDVTLGFVPGNHEDWNQIDSWNMPKDEHGHQKIRENLFYLGKVNTWTWDDVRFASIGGAVSIDEKWRTPQVDWWPQEQLTYDELNQIRALEPVDVLFSHDCPTTIPMRMMNHLESAMHRGMMNIAADVLRPKTWFHGHMHIHAKYMYNNTEVYGLDADPMATDNASFSRSNAIYDLDTGEVSEPKRITY